MSQFGLILCGGESSRMGTNKAFISYHGKAQWEYLYDMMKPLCHEVYISCQASQEHLFPAAVLKIIDLTQYANAGPMTGILSAFELLPGNHWLVCGCDYPLIVQSDLAQIISHSNTSTDIVCFRNLVTGIDEPLIAWYNSDLNNRLINAYKTGAHSLRMNFSNWSTYRIIPDEWNRLFSIDTSEQRDQILGPTDQ